MAEERLKWNIKAKTYPRYEPGDNNYEAGILRRIKENGADFTGKRVLDIGSGSGMYTIRIAQTAAEVTALDISDEMLRLLAEDAAGLGINNIATVNKDWLEYEADKPFDMVFASMTPALFPEKAKEKLLTFETEKTVYIAYNGNRRSNITAPLSRRQDTRPFLKEALVMEAFLDKKGRSYKEIPVTGSWEQKLTRQEIDEILNGIKREYGVNVPPDYREKFYDKKTGKYKQTMEYAIKILIF